MTDKLDDLAKTLASEEMPRRKMLGRVAGALGGGLLAMFAGGRSAEAAPPVRCPPGLTNCNGVCRDTAINPDHCGTCGSVCGAGEMCRSGVCVACTCAASCPEGQTSCGGTCVDLETDANHCGSCSNVCGSGQSCVNGQCSDCLSGQTNCGGTCVDLSTDENHCGACGQVCTEGTTCENGQCVPAA